MLSSEQSIVGYKNGMALPDRLGSVTHKHYVQHAERMLAVYRSGAGQMRRDLHRSIAGIFADEAECPSKRIQAFCKLLDDAAEFETDPHGNAAELRLRVFSLAAPKHPLTRTGKSLYGTAESQVKEGIAEELGRPWDEIDAGLYADVIDFQRMKSFVGYESPAALLRHYNVAQVQACLYRAVQMSIVARTDFRKILRHIKFARLMFEIINIAPSTYRIDLSGPASLLSETRRYGIQFAQVIPALLSCEDWTLDAVVQTPWRSTARFSLTSADKLQSHLAPAAEFDSDVEKAFAEKFGERRDGWALIREGEILHAGQTTFVPDFVSRYDDGTEINFEIVGFWTAAYLAKKREMLRLFQAHRILLAVNEAALTAPGQLPDNVIPYKTVVKIEPVLAAINKLRQ